MFTSVCCRVKMYCQIRQQNGCSYILYICMCRIMAFSESTPPLTNATIFRIHNESITLHCIADLKDFLLLVGPIDVKNGSTFLTRISHRSLKSRCLFLRRHHRTLHNPMTPRSNAPLNPWPRHLKSLDRLSKVQDGPLPLPAAP